MNRRFPAGVATGQMVTDIFEYAKENNFALPAVNVIGSSNANAVMETAAKLNSPVIIQFSNGGAAYNAGKGLSNDGQKAAIAGAVAGAKHIHTLAEAYGATVILHTDHCAKNLLPWIDGLMDANEELRKPENPYIHHTCLIFRKNRSKRTLTFPANISKEWQKWE